MGFLHGKTLRFSTSFLIFYVIFLCLAISKGNNEIDQLALLKFKSKIIDDPLGVTKSWNSTNPVCEWYGVTCGNEHERVVGLNLQGSQIVGSISPFIGNLSFLRDLQLENNSFSGEIPPEIGRLHRLQNLQLNDNSLVGKIPTNISRCSNLVTLKLGHNTLVGSIPNELGFLSNLNYLSLNVNNLTGIIPSSLGKLASLSTLYLGYNNFVGNVPNSLSKLRNLTILALGNNMLSGEIPPQILNISSLTIVDFGDNKFRGNLPSSLGITLPNLQFFSVSNNNISGLIPTSISNASNLGFLQLNLNNFVGQVPSLQNLQNLQHLMLDWNILGTGKKTDFNFMSSLHNATMLEILTINNNNFGGLISESICNLSSSLTILKISNNMISGRIPDCIEKFVNLQGFAIWDTQLSGVIPPNIGMLKNLEILDFSQNQLSGFIPSSIGNLTSLTDLFFPGNNLRGSIPETLQTCGNLLQLDLSQNNLSGEIPFQIFTLSSLSYGLNLSHNHLTGILFKGDWDMSNLISIDISNNEISGDIPNSIGSCVQLETISMQGNLLQGSIPLTLNTLKSVQEIDFSRNNISGEIPEFLASLPLTMLNLSYNNLEGRVPINGAFNNVSAISLAGNNKLCGGIPSLNLQMCKNSTNSRSHHAQILTISLVLGSFGFFLVLIFTLRHFIQRRNTRNKPNSEPSYQNLLNLSYTTLLKATNGFSTENLIGSGGFGSVYKGILDTDQQIVAIKVLNLQNQGALKSFMAECNALRNIRHRNLVKILTACSGVDYKGNDFKALVYEFMANGSLEDWLHESKNDYMIRSSKSRTLNLCQRLNIVVDVAFALEYLHHYSTPALVHCDMKPSNILLDDEMNACVGDFGLAKFLLEGFDGSSVSQSNSEMVRGTTGYTPPEYGMGNEVSTCGDVYSFGILLLELFTGKRPTDVMLEEGSNLHNFVKQALPERVLHIIDPLMLDPSNDSNTGHNGISYDTIETLISALQIGLSCCAELPRERSDIKLAKANLVSIRDRYMRSH